MKQKAIVYCEGAFNTPKGKTAHGLVRFTKRYQITSVIDSSYAGKDAGEVLDGKTNQIPILLSLPQALRFLKNKVSHLVIGLAPDGGRLSKDAPAREEYDGFPGYPIHPLAKQIEVIELLSGKPVVAITINHEKLSLEQIPIVCDAIASIAGIPTFDVLKDGAEDLAKLILASKRSHLCK